MCRIEVLCFIVFYYFVGVSSLRCNLCIGSTSSDCAKGVKTGMVVQTCGNNYLGKDYHPRKYTRPMMTTPDPMTAENNDIGYGMNTTESPMTITENSTIWHHGTKASPFMDKYCVYLRVKGNSKTTPMVDRGCGYIAPKQNLCNHIKTIVDNIETCQLCNTDLCN